MKFFSTAAFVSTIIALASAQQQPPVSITAPLTGTKYQAGSKAVISWTKPTVPKISQIVLAKGDANALQPIATIARDINAADGKYEWDVPYDCENGDQCKYILHYTAFIFSSLNINRCPWIGYFAWSCIYRPLFPGRLHWRRLCIPHWWKPCCSR